MLQWPKRSITSYILTQVPNLTELLFQQYFHKMKIRPDTPWISLTVAPHRSCQEYIDESEVMGARPRLKGCRDHTQQPQVIHSMIITKGLRAEVLQGCPAHLNQPIKIRQLLHMLKALEDPVTCSVNIQKKLASSGFSFMTGIMVPPNHELMLL